MIGGVSSLLDTWMVKVAHFNPMEKTIIEFNREKIEQIQLSEEEVKEAIWERKVKKYFHEKNKHYWNEQESRNATMVLRGPRLQETNH